MRRLAALAIVAVAVAGCGGSSSHAKPPAAWRSVATPALPGTALLTGVSCVSRSFCMAVGSRLRRLVSHTLVERWDGASWHVVPTLARFDRRSNLAAVSCSSPSFCAAVGNHFAGGAAHGLIEVWNGRAWRVTPTGGPATANALAAVSCASADFCVAVGTAHGGVARPVVQTWRGARWTLAPAPAGAGSGSLAAVSCLRGPFCVAVGQRSSGSGVSTLAESFDGARGRLERSPGVTAFSSLTGVSCVSADWCVAVGSHYNGEGTETLVLRREATWSLRPSPSRSFMSGFSAVSCVTETACVAVGSQRAAEANHTLIAGWDGAEWTIPASPDPPGTDVLSSASCVHDDEGTACVAVGTSGRSSASAGSLLSCVADRQRCRVSTDQLMPPCSQTGVGGRIDARNAPPPFGRTSSEYATGSQRRPLTGSPVPGTSGEKRAVAVATPPEASVTRTAVSAPG